MEDGVCSKGYPKEFRDATEVGHDSYAAYRRRDDGRRITKCVPIAAAWAAGSAAPSHT